MSSCIYIPMVNINGEEKPSKLFQDLNKVFEKREDVKEIWALLQVDSFANRYDLKKVNGEYQINDVIKALNIENVLENKLSRTFLKKQAGFINEDGQIKVFSNYTNALFEANNFNNTHKYHNALITKTDNGFSIDIKKRSISEDALKDQLFNSDLNNRLFNILKSLGFDLAIVENLQQNGIFNPLNSELNADGLIKIIEIAKGERGEKAFPEEFSHLIIAGLRNQPLIRRALESLSEEQIQSVLGNEYEQYKKDYNNNQQLLKEECLGKMLSEALQNNFKNDDLGFLKRIWNFIKNIFSKGNANDIVFAKNEARRAVNEIADQLLADEFDKFSLDKDEIFSSKTMYQIEEKIKDLEGYAKKGSELARLWMKEKAAKTSTGQYADADIEAIKEIDKSIESGNYINSCCLFLNNALREIKDLDNSIKKIKENNPDLSNEAAVRAICLSVVNLKNHTATYKKIIKELAALDLNYEEIGITKEAGEIIANLAKEVRALTNSVSEVANTLTVKAVKEFLKPYWKDKKISTKFIKEQVITIDTLLTEGFNDISFADNLVNALSESSDILLSLMAKISIHQQDLRDNYLIEDDAYIRDCERKLREAGYNDTKFMFDVDENGKPTGWLISDRNSVAFEKARQAYKDELEKMDVSQREKLSLLQKWDSDNTIEITKMFRGQEITVTVPNDSYKYEQGKSPLDRLSKAQREYYDDMMLLKAMREALLPKYKQNFYRAVQIRNDFVETLSHNISNPKELWKQCIEKVKDNFIRRVDDTEFGEFATEGENIVLLNARGKPVKQVPIFYINSLEDMSQLSMDFGGAMRAFSATTLNFSMMNDILPQMELLNDIIQDRKVSVQEGGKFLKSVQKILGVEVEQKYEKQGKELRIGKAAEFLMDKFYYGIHKANENTIGNSNIDSAKMLDFIKAYTSLVGMGLNVYSGISNLTMGGMQMVIEAIGGENFGYGDLAKAHLLYDKDIIGCIGENNSVKRQIKLSLLMDKFDSLESLYDNIKTKAFYKNGSLRAMKDLNAMILNEIGEHRLHNVTMLAILNHTKVKLNGKEISLYDALEVSKERIDDDGKKIAAPPHLKVKDGVTKLDGTEFTEEDFIKIKRQVSRTNRRLHGAYSEAFKGKIHQHALGRLAMQFRQWMPAFYSNRFGKQYYDVELEDVEEGYYVTMFNFATKMMKDVAKMKFELGTNWSNLTEHQKANMKKALLECGLLALLCWLAGMLGKIDDKESTWGEKMLKYQMLRLRLEVGAGVPFHADFFDNIWTMMQSPAAAIKSCNNVTDLLKFWNLNNEIQTGRYQGYSRYHKDFIECLPLYGQIRKVIDLKDDNYMFNIYNQK